MLKLQYFSHLMQRADSVEKTLMLRKIEDKRRKGWQMMRWTIKEAEHRRIDAFELCCWRRLLSLGEVLEKTQESLECWRRLKSPFWKEIQPVHPKGDQS